MHVHALIKNPFTVNLDSLFTVNGYHSPLGGGAASARCFKILDARKAQGINGE